MEFRDDTGATVCMIWEEDVQQIVNIAGGQKARYIDHAGFRMAGGTTSVLPICEIQMNMFDANGNEMVRWTPMPVCIQPGHRPVGTMRLSGPFVRRCMFTATAPDPNGCLWIGRTKSALTVPPFPSVDIDAIPLPQFNYTQQPAPAAMGAWLRN